VISKRLQFVVKLFGQIDVITFSVREWGWSDSVYSNEQKVQYKRQESRNSGAIESKVRAEYVVNLKTQSGCCIIRM